MWLIRQMNDYQRIGYSLMLVGLLAVLLQFVAYEHVFEVIYYVTYFLGIAVIWTGIFKNWRQPKRDNSRVKDW